MAVEKLFIQCKLVSTIFIVVDGTFLTDLRLIQTAANLHATAAHCRGPPPKIEKFLFYCTAPVCCTRMRHRVNGLYCERKDFNCFSLLYLDESIHAYSFYLFLLLSRRSDGTGPTS